MTAKLLLIKSENGLETRQEYDGIASSQKGIANGVAELDGSGRIPSGQLPSYVDDVLEYSDFSLFPATGETGKIYLATGGAEANKTFRWSGSIYVEISKSLALGETSATAYRGDRGKTAYDHSQATGNPHGTTAADVGAFAKWYAVGGIDFHGFSTPGVYELRGNSWANGWASLTGTQGVALLQMHDADGLRVLVAGDTKYGGLMLKFQASETPGDHWSPWFMVWDSGSLPASAVGKSVLAATDAAAARTAIGAAGLPSKADVTTSGNLGDISASVVKVTAPGVTLTLAGGYNAQGWDIVNPVDAVDFAIPAGVTLFRNGGASLGPATYSPGSGKALRIVRADASTWIMPNLV